MPALLYHIAAKKPHLEDVETGTFGSAGIRCDSQASNSYCLIAAFPYSLIWTFNKPGSLCPLKNAGASSSAITLESSGFTSTRPSLIQ